MSELSKLLHLKYKARDLVFKSLKESKILYYYEIFVLSAYYLTLRQSPPTDESRNDSFTQSILRATGGDRIDETKIKSLREELLKLTPEQIKQLAAERAKDAAERRKDDANFLLGLFRMWHQ